MNAKRDHIQKSRRTINLFEHAKHVLVVHVIKEHNVGILWIFLERNRIAIRHIDAALVHLAHAWAYFRNDNVRVQKTSRSSSSNARAHLAQQNANNALLGVLGDAEIMVHRVQQHEWVHDHLREENTRGGEFSGTRRGEKGRNRSEKENCQRPKQQIHTSVGIELALAETD